MLVNTLLVKSIKKMSVKEQKQMLVFAASASSACKPEVLALLHFIVERLHSTHPLTETDAWEHIHASGKRPAFDGKQFRYLLTYALALVRDYLTHSQLNTDAHTRQRLLLYALRDHQIDDLLAKEHAESTTLTLKHTIHDSDWHLHQYHLHKIALDLPASVSHANVPDYRPAQEQLTAYFCAEYLRTTAMVLAQEAFAKAEHKLPFLHTVLQMSAMLQTPHEVVQMYAHLVQVFMHPEQAEHFARWKETFNAIGKSLTRKEQREVFLIGLNYCIKQMNSGQRTYIREAFDLYKQALTAEILQENGWLTAATYKNIIRIGTALEEHTWVAEFYEQQKKALHLREREDAYAYNGAFLYFHRKEYSRAMPLLQRTNLTDRLNNLDARRMLLRTYFELNEIQALDSLLASFGAYLRRQKDLGYHREMYLHLIHYTRQLIDADRLTQGQRLKLVAEIKAQEYVAEREWLLSKFG
jgi:tetratricopeptide (TPR) repeat protein